MFPQHLQPATPLPMQGTHPTMPCRQTWLTRRMKRPHTTTSICSLPNVRIVVCQSPSSDCQCKLPKVRIVVCQSPSSRMPVTQQSYASHPAVPVSASCLTYVSSYASHPAVTVSASCLTYVSSYASPPAVVCQPPSSRMPATQQSYASHPAVVCQSPSSACQCKLLDNLAQVFRMIFCIDTLPVTLVPHIFSCTHE